MWRKAVRLVLVLAFLLGAGSWLLLTGWKGYDANRRLDEDAATVEGTVIDAATRELSKGGQSFTVVVDYQPAGSARVVRAIDVDGSTYRRAMEDGKVEVHYLPEDPRISRINRFDPLPYLLLAGFGGVMVLAGLACAARAIVKRS